MQTKIFQLWLGTAKMAVFCSLLTTLFSVECLASGPPPVITVQPLDQTVPNGGTAFFTVTATSATTLSYQWNQKIQPLNLPILGATNNTFILNNVSLLSAGKYTVSVMNAGGTETSGDARLAVTNRTTITTNTPPVANDDAVSTPENVPLHVGGSSNTGYPLTSIINAASVLDNDTDANGDALTATLVTNVTHGSLTFNSDGTFRYMPETDFFGNDSFVYVANDGTDNSRPATVTITVTAVSNSYSPPTVTEIGRAHV